MIVVLNIILVILGGFSSTRRGQLFLRPLPSIHQQPQHTDIITDSSSQTSTSPLEVHDPSLKIVHRNVGRVSRVACLSNPFLETGLVQRANSSSPMPVMRRRQ